jgi:hypothetical protein
MIQQAPQYETGSSRALCSIGRLESSALGLTNADLRSTAETGRNIVSGASRPRSGTVGRTRHLSDPLLYRLRLTCVEATRNRPTPYSVFTAGFRRQVVRRVRHVIAHIQSAAPHRGDWHLGGAAFLK